METYNEDFMKAAITASERGMSQGSGGPFGAVIVKDGRIIAEGYNRVLENNDPTAHAEVMAIRAACAKLGDFQLVGCELYSSCEPCPMCLGAIYWARPDKVFFSNTKDEAGVIGFDDAFIYDELALPGPRRLIPFFHVPTDDAAAIFRQWQRKSDKIQY